MPRSNMSWASFMRCRAAAENFLRFLVGATGVAAVSPGPPDSMARSSAIFESICRFCSSNPRIAAVMISGVSFCIDMSAFRTIHVNPFCGSRNREALCRLQEPGHVFVSPWRTLPGPDLQPVQLLGDLPERFAALPQPVNPLQDGLLARFRFYVALVGGLPVAVRRVADEFQLRLLVPHCVSRPLPDGFPLPLAD